MVGESAWCRAVAWLLSRRCTLKPSGAPAQSKRAASTRCGPCVCEGSGGADQAGISGNRGLLLHALLLASRPVVSLIALAITGCVLVGSFRALVVVALLPCPRLVIACHAGAATGKASLAAWAGGAGGGSRSIGLMRPFRVRACRTGCAGSCSSRRVLTRRAGCAGSPRRRVRSRRALRAAFSTIVGSLARTAGFACRGCSFSRVMTLRAEGAETTLRRVFACSAGYAGTEAVAGARRRGIACRTGFTACVTVAVSIHTRGAGYAGSGARRRVPAPLAGFAGRDCRASRFSRVRTRRAEGATR